MSSTARIIPASGRSSTRTLYTDIVPARWSMSSAVDAFPCGSRSTTSTRDPCCASDAARLTAVVVLPTPPFWLAIVMTRHAPGRGQGRSRPPLGADPASVTPGTVTPGTVTPGTVTPGTVTPGTVKPAGTGPPRASRDLSEQAAACL